MIKVLFVCLGNICRSPMAEAIFIQKIKSLKWDSLFEVDSCGTGDFHIGSQPDDRTVREVRNHAIEISHACRQLVAHDLTYFDYIVAMDKSNRHNILSLSDSPSDDDKVLLMRDFDSIHTGSDVPDPYHGGEKEFRAVFEILNRSVDGFIEHIRKNRSL